MMHEKTTGMLNAESNMGTNAFLTTDDQICNSSACIDNKSIEDSYTYKCVVCVVCYTMNPGVQNIV